MQFFLRIRQVDAMEQMSTVEKEEYIDCVTIQALCGTLILIVGLILHMELHAVL